MKLLANENFPTPSIKFLRSAGYDITSISEDYSGISDEFVMHIAQTEQRTIITFDRDYGELIFKHNYKPKNGVIYLRLSEYTPEEPGEIVQKLLEDYKIEPEQNLIVFDGLMIRQRKY